jgi:hypothetical protein
MMLNIKSDDDNNLEISFVKKNTLLHYFLFHVISLIFCLFLQSTFLIEEENTLFYRVSL